MARSTPKKSFLAGIASALFLLACPHAWAQSVDVEASFPSGSYDGQITVELRTTDPNARTFYSFNPDGTPNDAMLYTGAIVIRRSTALMYFSYIDERNESKIKRNDYTIRYSDAIRISTGTKSQATGSSEVVLVNAGLQKVDVSGWYLMSETASSRIPEGTMIDPGQTYGVTGVQGSGIIGLYAPDDTKKGFVDIVSPGTTDVLVPSGMPLQARAPKATSYRKPRIAQQRGAPKTVAVTSKTPSELGTHTTDGGFSSMGPSGSSSGSIAGAQTSPTTPSEPGDDQSGNPKAPESTEQVAMDLGKSMKASVNESSGSSGRGMAFAAIVLGLGAAAGIARKYLRTTTGHK